jgi:AcrR family transcriptional regulator
VTIADRNGRAELTASGLRRAQRFEEIVSAAWAIAHEQGLGAMTLHEVARRVGLRQPSLYVYVESKLDLYDAMFAQANAELLARVDRAGESGSAREQLLRLSRVVLDFAVEDPARQHLLFTRSIPGFTPSAQSYALAEQLVQRTSRLLAELGCSSPQADVYTALIAGLCAQQIANDPGGDRWTRHLEPLLELFLDHFPDPSEPR